MIAATVGDEVISVAEVDRRMRDLYEGPLAARLPHPASPEGRNLRRWLVQLMTMERVVAQEYRDLRKRGESGQTASDGPAGGPDQVAPVTLPIALRTGGVIASVLSTPAGQSLFTRIDAGLPPDEVRAYYDRNRDRHPGPFDGESAGIAAQLVQARKETLFVRWLERRHREKVTLMPGFEHPGDPRQPDATHRH
ncbi:DUF7158 domain-containing protein [Herbidospora mongoliensis]|uniref:DUF7158 domain-containing protein n=1 Tax=Herbidospora mongoliensis TaxID=688067 RepID=UPI00082FF5E5|nr:hypothetical protein [Herbidospora mongoliensis]